MSIMGSSPSFKQLIVLALGYYAIIILLVSPIDGANQKIDVPAEIKKFEEKFETFERPSPEVVNSFIDQIRQSCRTNRTIDETQMKNISTCIDGLFNETALVNELQESIPKGALDNVFRNLCLKWPKVQNCMKPGFSLIEECWENGTLVNAGVDTMVQFFCGANNDGAYIALFFAEGGLTCLETHGEKVRDCVGQYSTDDHNQENLCRSVHQIYTCLDPLKKCKDDTPHNLITSMVKEVGRVMQCQENFQTSKSSTVERILAVPYLILFSLTAYILQN